MPARQAFVRGGRARIDKDDAVAMLDGVGMVGSQADHSLSISGARRRVEAMAPPDDLACLDPAPGRSEWRERAWDPLSSVPADAAEMRVAEPASRI